MSIQILYTISANKKLAGPFVTHISVSELAKYISKLENLKIVWSEWCKQPTTKIVIAIHNRLAYVLIYASRKKPFPPSELKKSKVVPLSKSTNKTNPTSYRPVSLPSVFFLFQSFSKSTCTFI